MNSYRTGLFSEFLACVYLILHGFRVIKHRHITGRNTNRAEIDIIARRKNLIIFVEVKKRKTINAAWWAIGTIQSHRLRRAAETYLLQKRWTGDARFDVIIIHGWRIDWIKNAF